MTFIGKFAETQILSKLIATQVLKLENMKVENSFQLERTICTCHLMLVLRFKNWLEIIFDREAKFKLNFK